MKFVVNEWLLDLLRPDADTGQQKLALHFINTLVKKCDKIVVRIPSPFFSKFWRLGKQFERDADFKRRFKKLHELLFRNSVNTVIIDDAQTRRLPDEVARRTPPDDLYLIELAYSMDKTLITTDGRLVQAMEGVTEVRVVLLQEFMKAYA